MLGYEYKTAIHSNQFMIIAMDTDSREFVAKPTVYSTYAEVLHSAQNLASKVKYVKYIVVAVAAIAESIDNPVIVTKYRLD